MEGASQLVAALRLHGFHLSPMEGVQCQMLHLSIVLMMMVEVGCECVRVWGVKDVGGVREWRMWRQ